MTAPLELRLFHTNRSRVSNPSTLSSSVPTPDPHAALHLIPRDHSTPILLVAGAKFRLGRSPVHSDWVARFQPETPENEILTNEIGRVHVVGEILGGWPVLNDGNGAEASINGSTFDGQRLTADLGTPVRRRGVLTLGEQFALDVVPFLADADDIAPGDGHAEIHGAITFAPRRIEPTLREAVWIFTRVDFAIRPSGGPAWLPLSRENPAAFLRRDGRFLLANMHLPGEALVLNEHVVSVGEIVPLSAGETLRIGARAYSLESH